MNDSKSTEIVVQQLKTFIPGGTQTYSEVLLEGEIDGLKINHLAFVGPFRKPVNLPDGHTSIFLFVKGKGKLHADTVVHDIHPESIAVPLNGMSNIALEIPKGEIVHLLQFIKRLSPQDIEDLNNSPVENKPSLFFTRFKDCPPYTEKIKSPNTISRTVLPENIVPRVSLGTVEAMGPDKVGAHKHPMLEQLFLGLADNDIMVYADDASANFREYSLLHIPIGSTHWVSVDEHKKMNYMWMDFFLTKEGQAWLKTHKPINSNEEDAKCTVK